VRAQILRSDWQHLWTVGARQTRGRGSDAPGPTHRLPSMSGGTVLGSLQDAALPQRGL